MSIELFCPNFEDHTPHQPVGYIEWHAWAEQMGKTHRQRKCRGCGLYQVWEPKAASVDGRRMAETGTGSGRSPTSAVAKPDAQTPTQSPSYSKHRGSVD